MVADDLQPAGKTTETIQLKKQLRTNWAANITYSTNVIHEVTSIKKLQELLRSKNQVKVVGTGHTFNEITDGLYNRLSLRLMPQVLDLDTAARTVTVDASITYAQLCPILHRHGFALPNLASIMELSVVGACSTAAHGSGDGIGNLATAISALEIVTCDGRTLKLSRQSKPQDDEEDQEDQGLGLNPFFAAAVGLGALGIITQVTLDVQPAFTMGQYVYEDLPLNSLQDHFDEVMSSGYSVSLFTDWQRERIVQVWVKVREDSEGQPWAPPSADLFGGTLQMQKNLNMTMDWPFERCNEQMGIPGPWHERLPHFRLGMLAPVGAELQTEYFVPRHHAVDAILAVERLRDQIAPVLFISEIRSVAADDLWMSTCYGRDSVAIHFTWKPNWAGVKAVLPGIERALAPFGPRPHWGKLFAMAPALVRAQYKKLPEFQRVAAQWDPYAKLCNEYLDSILFNVPSPPTTTI